MDHVRLAHPGDAAAVAAIYAPSVTRAATSFELTAPSPDDIADRIAAGSPHAPWLVLVRDGEIAGYAYASRHRERAAYQWSVDVTAYVREDARGSGVGKRLYGALFDVLVRLGYFQAFAGIALPNAASVALHESMGFAPIGVYRQVGFKHGRWHDVG